jgi:hypothetical protein
MLVITWNSKHDITEWKLENNPQQHPDYIPPPEGDW